MNKTEEQRAAPGFDQEMIFARLRMRQITETDLPALEWEGEYIHYRQLYADAYALARQGKAVLWLSEVSGVGLIGQVFVSLPDRRPAFKIIEEKAYIYGFRVRPAFRGRGIGTFMMKFIEDDIYRRGYRCVTLNVARDNPDALRFYERLGYRIIAPEAGNWSYIDHLGVRQEVHEPAWRMEKKLRSI